MQLSLSDYYITEKSGWQIPLHEYLKLPESRDLSKTSLLDTDLSRETPETLTRFRNAQLELLCMYWGTTRSGTKAEKIDNLLNTYKAHQTIANLGKAGLFKLTMLELKKIYCQVAKGKGSHHTKRSLIESLLMLQETVHNPFLTLLAKARHREEVKAALRIGMALPDKVIRSCPEYVVLHRVANGLPIEPEEMTGREWAVFALQAMPGSYRTDKQAEIERRWHIVERAIREGKRLKPEVLADHEERTWLREIEKQKAIPQGPGWKPADLRTVRPGDALYRTDGIQVKVIETEGRVVARNLSYGWKEELEDGRAWLETPFHIGDKVRWASPDGRVRVGRIKHARPRPDQVFGEEFFILTGGKFKGFDHPEFFTAPVGEVEKEEAII